VGGASLENYLGSKVNKRPLVALVESDVLDFWRIQYHLIFYSSQIVGTTERSVTNFTNSPIFTSVLCIIEPDLRHAQEKIPVILHFHPRCTDPRKQKQNNKA
jgi:hypothetical protein